MPSLSQGTVQMKMSGIREIMNMAIGMPDVVRLEVGEPQFPTPPHIVEAAYRGAREGFTRYTANAGLASLRAAIARKVREENGRPVTEANVAVAVGGVGASVNAIRALTDPGDEVLIPDPCWPTIEMVVAAVCAVPRWYSLRREDGFLPSIARLEKEITPRTKVLFINSPSNPLGTVFPAELLKDLVEFARRHDVFLIHDEVYEKLVFEGEHVSAGIFDTDGRVISLYSFSKTYAMTGWRVGYAVAAEPIVEQMTKLQEPFGSCAPSVSQKAAEAAITGPHDFLKEMINYYAGNLAVAREVLDRHDIWYLPPRGAFYLWVDAECEDSMAFARRLLTEERVSVAPGAAFGPTSNRFIRISLASSTEDIRVGLERTCRMIRAENRR